MASNNLLTHSTTALALDIYILEYYHKGWTVEEYLTILVLGVICIKEAVPDGSPSTYIYSSSFDLSAFMAKYDNAFVGNVMIFISPGTIYHTQTWIQVTIWLQTGVELMPKAIILKLTHHHRVIWWAVVKACHYALLTMVVWRLIRENKANAMAVVNLTTQVQKKFVIMHQYHYPL